MTGGIQSAGSSPLTRGKHRAAPHPATQTGLIPAHAGKTSVSSLGKWRTSAHPRSRGENDALSRALDLGVGSSPLTRGKLGLGACSARGGGLIPAHAGKTSRRRCRRWQAGAHPRSRGENISRPPLASWKAGSSPLTRGKRNTCQLKLRACGLIPAHAGKTDGLLDRLRSEPAHPRSRGENVFKVSDGHANRWLIPAHAGKTSSPCQQ